MNDLKKANDTKIIKLIAALAIDGMGLLSYLIPGAAELFDAVWAPISAVIVYYMFGRKLSWASFTFLEELFPFTDVVPSATIAWYFHYHKSNKKQSQY
ncbi:MAG: hypothetical protein K9I97_02900 [Cryomorphaceae bacterium]|jgi:hypothetical protein|nr:hypothetical protein [Cryomorphaceae bacterium]